MNIIDLNGISLAYDSFGNPADAPMLLIAGLGTQMIRWTPTFCEGLAVKGFYGIRFDNRDAGGSIHLSEYGAPDFARSGSGPDDWAASSCALHALRHGSGRYWVA